MGRERQKKKNRSSKPKVRPRSNRTKAGKKKVNFLGNEIIAKNWDRSLTVSQNYELLGLSSRLKNATGGSEKRTGGEIDGLRDGRKDSLAIGGSAAGKMATQEIQVERDPETGRILRVVGPEGDEATSNPLNDPLNDIMDVDMEPHPTSKSGVVAQLEAQALEEAESVQKRRPRQQSQREDEWIGRLVDKHGDNIKAMVKDRKLNPMQQTEGDISRRIRKWKANQTTPG